MIEGLLLTSLLAFAGADEGTSADALRSWLEYYQEEAAAYEMRVDRPSSEPLALHPQTLLTYTNSVRGGQQHGAVYVWTDQARPAVVGSIWSSVPRYDQSIRSITNEFVSLSTEPVYSRREQRVGRRGPVPDWGPGVAGVELESLPGAPEPARARALRLAQMRRLAASFDAKIAVSELEEQQTLRLQPQPLYRYASPSTGVIDSALFSLVLATDPELFLLLEAREDENGPGWHYALARFTDRPLKVRLEGREVWSCAQAEPYVGDQPYFLYWGVATRPRESE